MSCSEQIARSGFQSHRRHLYKRLRWWASKQLICEGFFLLFRDRYVTRNSDLVIEGYPRSGNSFARWAFVIAQKNPVVVADHFHSIGHIRRGIRLGKPVLVLVRNPLDAISSFLVHQKGNYAIQQAVKEYIEIYSYVYHHQARMVVATFEQVTFDFGAVTEMVNQRFSTHFEQFLHTEENVRRCFQIMENRSRRKMGDPSERVYRISRPVPSRKSLKNAVIKEMLNESYAGLLQKAGKIYEKVVRCAL